MQSNRGEADPFTPDGNIMPSNRKTTRFLQKLAELPTDKIWFASATGFVVGTIVWIVELGKDTINVIQLGKYVVGLLCVYTLALTGGEWWMGSRFSSQHRLNRILMFLIYATGYGVTLSGIAYDIVVLMLLKK